MVNQIENTEAYKNLEGFQKSLVIKRDNRLQIENAIVIVRTIGYNKWNSTTNFSTSWRAIVRELTDELTCCESCEKPFDMDIMTTDADDNWFCPECWEVLEPEMQKEYEELVARGEIEEKE